MGELSTTSESGVFVVVACVGFGATVWAIEYFTWFGAELMTIGDMSEQSVTSKDTPLRPQLAAVINEEEGAACTGCLPFAVLTRKCGLDCSAS